MKFLGMLALFFVIFELTTAAPNTTIAASAPPEPSIGTWNSSCIMIKLAAQLNFTYLTKDDKNATTLYNLPTDAKVQDPGYCDSTEAQKLQLNWGPADSESHMIIQFDMKNKTVQMTMIQFVLALTADRFPDAKENKTIELIHQGFDFSAPAKMSYHCTRSQKFNLTERNNGETIIGTLTVHDVQVEAFRDSNSLDDFSPVHECENKSTTTTKAPKTTTVPYPEPSIGTWNSSCIKIKIAAQLNFTYLTKDDKNATAFYNLPADAKVREAGFCDSKSIQVLELIWGPAEAQSSMSILFEIKKNMAQISLIKFDLHLTTDRFPDAKENELIEIYQYDLDLSAPTKMSYHCKRSRKFNSTDNFKTVVIGTLTIHDLQVEAFRDSNSPNDFSPVYDCENKSTTTTNAPKTTTVAPNTTTPAPEPYPEPSIGTWNSSCIKIKMAAQLNFTYLTKDKKNVSGVYNLPTNAWIHNGGNCSSDAKQKLQLNWGPADSESHMIIQFDMKNNMAQMTMIQFVLHLTADRFPDAKENQTIELSHFGFDFSAPAEMSYHCTRSQKFDLTANHTSISIIGTLTVHDVQVEAFRSPNLKSEFSTPFDCDIASASTGIYIAIGVTILIVIFVTIFAWKYMKARRM